jgi:tRNA pseudouridine55 synthase
MTTTRGTMKGPSGILIVDKPAGPTSHDVVMRVRRHARGVRVGHAGTLDPGATGVLVLLLGKATKLAEVMMDESKEYEATIRLGRETDTGDADGVVTREHDGPLPSFAAIEAAVARFVGRIEQVPPMVSAIKVGGRRLYDLARAGLTVPRAARIVRIERAEIVAWDSPRLTLRVVCGRGTYLRALATDLGDALGVGGALDALRRTRVGRYRAADAAPLSSLLEALAAGDWSRLVAMDDALAHLPRVVVTEDQGSRILHGHATPRDEILSFPEEVETGAKLRVLDPRGRLLATARAVAPDEAGDAHAPRDEFPFRLERVLADPEEIAT